MKEAGNGEGLESQEGLKRFSLRRRCPRAGLESQEGLKLHVYIVRYNRARDYELESQEGLKHINGQYIHLRVAPRSRISRRVETIMEKIFSFTGASPARISRRVETSRS